MGKALVSPSLERRIHELPLTCGVYFFKDGQGIPIYIGKAISIRKRILSHFRAYGDTGSKAGMMLSEARRIDFIETPSEAEALLLEAALVKENQPKFNSLLKDDKSYPFLKLTAEEYPRLMVVRIRKSDGGRYFGPYTDVRLLKQAVGLLRRMFPMRTCKKLPKKVCLMYHIGQCGGPCENFQSKEDYLKIVKELENFLDGRRDAMVRTLTKRMKEFSAAQEFEKAKSTYEMIRALSLLPSGNSKIKERSSQIEELQKTLELPKTPHRMECFDISNISGKEAVASMVVFIDGRPAKSEYRKFKIKTVQGIDDYKMMREVVRRRYTRVLNEKTPLPDLVVIDGGKGHLSSAKAELDVMGLQDQPIISIAKQHEHLFKPGREKPYVLSLSSPLLQMIRHLRDEAHRFAIRYHRGLHLKESLSKKR